MFYANEVRKEQEFKADTALGPTRTGSGGEAIEAMAANSRPENSGISTASKFEALIAAKIHSARCIRRVGAAPASGRGTSWRRE